MDNKVEQLKLFLESIEEYDPKLVGKIGQVVDVIFEAEDEKMAAAKKLIAGGYETLPKNVKEKALEKRGLSKEDMDKAIAMWEKEIGSEKADIKKLTAGEKSEG